MTEKYHRSVDEIYVQQDGAVMLNYVGILAGGFELTIFFF